MEVTSNGYNDPPFTYRPKPEDGLSDRLSSALHFDPHHSPGYGRPYAPATYQTPLRFEPDTRGFQQRPATSPPSVGKDWILGSTFRPQLAAVGPLPGRSPTMRINALLNPAGENETPAKRKGPAENMPQATNKKNPASEKEQTMSRMTPRKVYTTAKARRSTRTSAASGSKRGSSAMEAEADSDAAPQQSKKKSEVKLKKRAGIDTDNVTEGVEAGAMVTTSKVLGARPSPHPTTWRTQRSLHLPVSLGTFSFMREQDIRIPLLTKRGERVVVTHHIVMWGEVLPRYTTYTGSAYLYLLPPGLSENTKLYYAAANEPMETVRSVQLLLSLVNAGRPVTLGFSSYDVGKALRLGGSVRSWSTWVPLRSLSIDILVEERPHPDAPAPRDALRVEGQVKIHDIPGHPLPIEVMEPSYRFYTDPNAMLVALDASARIDQQ